MTQFKTEDAPYPGFARGPAEIEDGTVQISDSNSTGTVSFSPDSGFDTAPRVATSYELESKSGSSSSTKVTRAEVTTRTTSSVVVTVELDTAPGAGETTTVRVDAWMFEG